MYSRNWKKIPIIPTTEEILNFDKSSKYELKKIVAKGEYPSASAYLDLLFKLLREDMIGPLRAGITKFLNGDQSFARELFLYENVKIKMILCNHKEGIIYNVLLEINKVGSKQWIRSGGLKYGTLLCIAPMQNGLPNFDDALWGVIASYNEEQGLFIKFQNGYEPRFKFGCNYLLFEPREVYFEAYAHTLTVLKNMDSKTLPMSAVILGNDKTIWSPKYLNNDIIYDFSDIFPNQNQLRVLGKWPLASPLFDISQYKAFRLAITKQLALIQGPPGCGKTYLGAHTIKILLKNRKILIDKMKTCKCLTRSENKLYMSLCKQPILVVTYTNHALDQFLMYLLDFEENFIRIGARSERDEIKMKTLAESRLKEHSVYVAQLKMECKDLKQQMDYIELLIREASGALPQLHSKILFKQDIESVASKAHIKSLFNFQNGYYKKVLIKENNTINFWINKLSIEDLKRERFLMSKNQTYFLKYSHLTNRFKVLVNASNAVTHNAIEEAAADKELLKSRLVNTGLLDDNSLCANINSSYHQPGTPVSSITIEVNDINIDNDADFHNSNNYSHNKYSNDNILSHSCYCRNDGDLLDGHEYTYNIPFEPIEEFEKLTLDEVVSCMKAENQLPTAANNISNHIKFCPDVWKLNIEERKILYSYWVELRLNQINSIIDNYASQYYKLSQELKEVYSDIDSYILNKAAIIGMTTTGAGKYSQLLKKVRPTIIFVEEAAEVLEAHIISCLSQNLEHLILIGDHQQLRPSNADYQLAKDYNLSLSLFERLINNEVEHVTLNCQHRMRPEISALIKPIYPSLEDHGSVLHRDDIKGVLHNIYFIDHQVNEDSQNTNSTTQKNTHEAKFVAKLALYLIDQGYPGEDITILTFYLGQKYLIKDFLYQYKNTGQINKIKEPSNVNVVTVDKFQGEESTIIIFSVVRSNVNNRVGFCKVDNRVCVALSRARDGFFIVGNASCLNNASKESESRLWEKVYAILKNKIGNSLQLCCQRHKGKITLVSKADDFSEVVNGGCNLECGEIMPCGHKCVLNCHPYSHEKVECNEICQKKFSCGHDCIQSSSHLCYQKCPPCQVKKSKILDICGHTRELGCSVSPRHSLCIEPCLKTLQCGHKCIRKCNEVCQKQVCTYIIQRDLPCGHRIETHCNRDPHSLRCVVALDCGHICTGRNISYTVRQDYNLKCNQICNKNLPCGHACKERCHKYYTCGPCESKCLRRCSHTTCKRLCGEPCYKCNDTWEWNCRHKVEVNNCSVAFRNCNRRCEQKIGCGHQCRGFCGEPCPNICDMCYPEDKNFQKYFGNESNIHAFFVVLEDCEHIFEAKGLDNWIDKHFKCHISDIIVQLPHCPKCKVPMFSSFRYLSLFQTTLCDIQKINYIHCKEFKLLLIDDCDEFKNTLRNNNQDEIRIKKFVEQMLYIVGKCRNGMKLKYFQECLQMLANVFIPSLIPASNIAHKGLITFSGDSKVYIISKIVDYTNNSEGIDATKKLHILLRKCRLVIQFDIIMSFSWLSSGDKKYILGLKRDFLSESDFNINKFQKPLVAFMPYDDITADQFQSSIVFRRPLETCKGDWYKCRQLHVYKAKLNQDGQPIIFCPDCYYEYII